MAIQQNSQINDNYHHTMHEHHRNNKNNKSNSLFDFRLYITTPSVALKIKHLLFDTRFYVILLLFCELMMRE